MRATTLLLSALMTASLQAQTFCKTEQFNLGQLLPTDSVSFKIEYPEYERLSRKTIDELRKQGFEAEEQVQFYINRGISRGETIVDVAYTPIVKRRGEWFAIKQYDLKPIVHNKGIKATYLRAAIKATLATDKAQRYADNSVLAEGKWVKIKVDKEGIYQLTNEQLKKAGFTDPSKVRLYGYGGRLITENFAFTGKNGLIDDLNEVPLYRREGSVLFYAEGVLTWNSNTKFTRNTFSNYSYYFLTEAQADETPASLKTLAAPVSETTEEVTTVIDHALNDNEAFVWYAGGRRFYDNNELQNGHTFKLSLPGNTGAECQIAYDVSAASKSTSTFTITNTTDGKQMASGYFSKLGEGEEARGYNGSFKLETNEEARFTISTQAKGRLNYLYATYQRYLTPQCNKAFTTEKHGNILLCVEGADNNTRVWKLGDAQSQVAELPGTLSGSTYKAHVFDVSDRYVVVNVAANYDSPTIVGNVENQNLHADKDIDYVIIVPASNKLTAQAERLAQAHRDTNGLRVKVVRADQLYNEFSSGTPDASAYRRYLKMLYDKAESMDNAPRYLLLFGECNYDNRMISDEMKNSSPDDYLLAYERSEEEKKTGEYKLGTLYDYVTEDYYGMLDDNEGSNIVTEKLDLGIGRFLCSDEESAKWLVDQAIRYDRNENTGAWKNNMWAIADAGNNNLHMQDAQGVTKQLQQSANEGFMLRRIFLDAYSTAAEAKGTTIPQATNKLKASMKQGALIFNYNGHGNPDRLSHYFLIDKSDMQTNVCSAMPLWIFASCEITPYDNTYSDLGRNALFNRNGGAMGVICASRSVYANYNSAINKGLIKYLFKKDDTGKRYSIGDAMRYAKVELLTSTSNGNTIGSDPTMNKLKYTFLGDPALTLAYAETGIAIDSIDHVPLGANSFSNMAVGRPIQFSGYVYNNASNPSPDTSFNGTLYATIFAPLQSITCKGTGNTTAKNFQYTDYTQNMFDGKVEVKDGKFTIDVIIPRGAELSTNASKLSLYAVNNDNTKEFNGTFDRFCFGRSANTEEADTIGPNVYMYLNAPDFPNGGFVGADATLYATIADSSGISMMSGNLGHDMELWFDGNSNEVYKVSDYFTLSAGKYNEGLLTYPLPTLSLGAHTATLRIWDVFDNNTTTTLSFNVTDKEQPKFDVSATTLTPTVSTRFITTFTERANSESTTPVITEVFNVSGLRVWHNKADIAAGVRYASFNWNLTDYAGNKVPAGVYLYRSKVGDKETSTKKIIIR